MAEQQSEQVWTWVGTPDPAQMIFALYVKTELITVDTDEKPSNKPKRESALGVSPYTLPTKFKELDAAFNAAHLCSLGVAEWYFIGESVGNPTTVFYFFKNKTGIDLFKPYEEKERVGDHYWPHVIYDIWIDSDRDNQTSTTIITDAEQGIASGPTNTVKALMIDDVSEGTTFVTRKYLSATQPRLNRPSIPHPLSLLVQVNGAERQFPKCLRPEIYIDPVPSVTKKFTPNTGVSDAAGATSGQLVEATNFTDRRPYILTSEPDRNAYGLWEWTEVEVIPPKVEEPQPR